MPPPYRELHVYLDESGRFRPNESGRRDPWMVGGVVVFGPLDPASEQALLDRLRLRVESLGGQFPQDLHHGNSGLAGPAKGRLLAGLVTDLPAWCGTERELLGVSLVHTADVHEQGSELIAERNADNRYLGMLWALLEHLLFVRPEVAPDAVVHLTVASRVFVFDPTSIPVEDIEALGYGVRRDSHRSDVARVFNIVIGRELVAQIRMALRHRWRGRLLNLTGADTVALDYDRPKSPPGLYLADLYLGGRRHAEFTRSRYDFPTLFHLEYGPWLDLLAEQRSALDAGDPERYLRSVTEFDGLDGIPDDIQSLDRQFEQTIAQSLRNRPEPIVARLRQACLQADLPGGSREGLRVADRCIRLLEHFSPVPLLAEILARQAQFSYANHTGHVRIAEEIWQRYLELEPRLSELGLEGQRLRLEMRNRRAVALTDQFRHGDAIATLRDLVVQTEGVTFERGKCLGTLGQALAFQGAAAGLDESEACFRQAMELFATPADRERQWVYLGHLAIQRGDAGRRLWEEVGSHLDGVRGATPITGNGRQFLLALQLKGLFVLGSSAECSAFLAKWDRLRPLESYSAEARVHHPFGLIHQALGLLATRVWREGGRLSEAVRASEAFAQAAAIMNRGGPLLQLLAWLARLRRERLELEVNSSSDPGVLARTFASFRAHAGYHFGGPGWSEDPAGHSTGYFGACDPGPGHTLTARVDSVLRAIRFNYW